MLSTLCNRSRPRALGAALVLLLSLMSGAGARAEAITPPPTDGHLVYGGGNILINPVFVNIYWGAWWTSGIGLTERQGVNAFVQTVGTSPQFYSLLNQYPDKNGASTQSGTFFGEFLALSEPGIPFTNSEDPEIYARITEQQIIDGIDQWIEEGLIPPPGPNIVYTVLLPMGIEVFDTDSLQSENSFEDYCAYHDNTYSDADSAEKYRFIVMPYEDNCAIETEQFATETVDLGHEMIETVNDPDFDAGSETDGSYGWYDAKYGEVADTCEYLADVTLLGYRVQTIWSNADSTCLATNIPDTVPPAITSTVNGTLGAGGWYRGPISITWSIVNFTLLTQEQGCDPTTLVKDTGSQTLTCRATDAGGSGTQSITVKLDATPPVISFAGNAETYSADQTIAITCTATDSVSGVAQSPVCTPRPAYTAAIGANTLSVSATDNAGNYSEASTSFTVKATLSSLINLTTHFVESSSRYVSSPPGQQGVARAIIAVAGKVLTGILPGLNAKQKAALINNYEADVAGLVTLGWVTSTQASILDRIANAL